jgi:glycosyltransferase involved in cell wall biosynthesis
MTDLRLVLFFTRGVSLRTWHDVGMLEREAAIYLRLRDHGVAVSFLTYGNASDLQYANQLGGIRIICNRWGLPEPWYVSLISWLYRPQWRGPTVFKSNQVQGADVALLAARRVKKKFIARCGYPYADFMERQHGPDSPEAESACTLEQQVFSGADRVVVTTPAMQHTTIQRHRLPPERIVVIPNYVDTDLFRPVSGGHHPSTHICFVGRLDEQKNPLALLRAIKDLDVELVIVGNGPLGGRLREEANLHGLAVRFLGNVPHRQLPEIINSAALFILPSHYEGHPKTLLEAMACGRPVIGTDVPGIRELIRHRETGYLSGTSPRQIRSAIQDLLSNRALCARMGRNAREFVVQNFALDRVLDLELAVLAQLVP